MTNFNLANYLNPNYFKFLLMINYYLYYAIKTGAIHIYREIKTINILNLYPHLTFFRIIKNLKDLLLSNRALIHNAVIKLISLKYFSFKRA